VCEAAGEEAVSLRKIRSVALAVVVCFVCAGAAPPPPKSDLAAAEKRSLWQVRSKSNVVYLLGSIHYLKPESYPLNRAMEAAFNDAKSVVFEIDLDSAEGGRAQEVMILKAAYTGGTTLKSHVSETTYKLAEERLKSLGLDIKIFNQFKPWLIAHTILALQMQAMGFDPKHGIDQYFFRKAKEEKKEILGFETLEYQFDIFNKMPEHVQELLLLQTLNGAESMRTAVGTIVKAWGSGDLKTLDAALLGAMREYPEVYRRVIVDRNRAWLPKVETYLAQTDNYLVIVSAGHLAGRDGLIEMLKAKGYSVEQ
jgi:uncharacterized protein YbaP (TraB family)